MFSILVCVVQLAVVMDRLVVGSGFVFVVPG